MTQETATGRSGSGESGSKGSGSGNPGRAGLLETLAIPAMVGVGALIAVQSDINGELSRQLGTGPRAGALAAVISFGSGLVLLALICLLSRRRRAGTASIFAAVRSGDLRRWQLLGGLAGALLVASQGLAVGTIGVALFTVAVVAGQTTSALGVDHRGLGPSGPQRVTRGRVVGAIVTIVAVVVSVSGRLSGEQALTAGALALALLPLLAGAGTSWQQAINGRVGAVGGPLPAAFNNFMVGTTALVVFLLVSLLFPGDVGALPGSWYLYLGGVIGVVFISSAAFLVKVHGVLVLGLCTVAGQIVTSILIDAFSSDSHLGVATVVGGVLTLAGVAVGAWASRRPTR